MSRTLGVLSIAGLVCVVSFFVLSRSTYFLGANRISSGGAQITSVDSAAQARAKLSDPIRIGWVGPMSGPVAHYGAVAAAKIALEEINQSGGVGGRPLELIMEDGRCDGKTAATVMQKLISIDRVKIIIGGHCTPESAVMVPLANRYKVLEVAALTSTPKLSQADDYFYRITPLSTKNGDVMGKYLAENGYKKLALLFAETDYVRPPAERLAEVFANSGGEVVLKDSFDPKEVDFTPLLLRVKAANPDALYVGVQARDSSDLLMKQAHGMGLKVQILGNEVVGNAPRNESEFNHYYENVIYAEPDFDEGSEQAKQFTAKYQAATGERDLPLGLLTAEAYDVLKLTTKLIGECGEDVDALRRCLLNVRNYRGATGLISINSLGDGVRRNVLKQTKLGTVTVLYRES